MRWIIGLIFALLLALIGIHYGAEYSLNPLDETAKNQAPGAFLSLPDGDLHYRWDGPPDGDTVVLVHGFSTPNFIYSQNVEALNAAGFKTLRYDHFGRGWSDRPKVDYTVDFYDQTLLALLDDQAVTMPINLIGLSMGGPIVAEFAARHPDRVKHVTLLVPAGLDLADTGNARILQIPLLGDWLWRRMGRNLLLSDRQYQEEALAPENRLAGNVAEQMNYRGYLDALLSTIRHMPMTGREATFKALAKTGIPTLAIYGDDDATVLVSSADKLRNLMPQADIRIISGGTHGLNYQRHRDINPVLIEALTPGAGLDTAVSQ